MNILIVNKYFFVSGGPERYMFTVTKALEKAGHKVVPLALKLDRNYESPYSHYFLKSPFGSHAAKLGEAKLSMFEKLKLAGRTIYYPAARRAVSQIIEQEQIDVVYLLNICNYIGPSVIAGAKDKGIRVVMRLSDFNFICAVNVFIRNGGTCLKCRQNVFNAIKFSCVNNSKLQSLLRSTAIALHKYSGIYRKVDACICPSRLMVNELVDFGIPKEKTHYLPSFVELENEKKPIENRGQYVLFFGRLGREKGVDILIKAWHLLGINAPQLLIIGSGPEEQTLYQMAANYKLDNIEFKPFLEHEEVIEYLRACTFVIIPSICHDNAPMAAFEAMAMRKAIVASRVGGLPDQIDDGLTGLLVPPGDASALAAAVMSLVNDPEQLAMMGKEAWLRAKHDFSQQSHINKLQHILQGDEFCDSSEM